MMDFSYLELSIKWENGGLNKYLNPGTSEVSSAVLFSRKCALDTWQIRLLSFYPEATLGKQGVTVPTPRPGL